MISNKLNPANTWFSLTSESAINKVLDPFKKTIPEGSGLGKLNKEVFYPHPPERVWQVITDSRAISAWLMENDFEPRVGCKFCFYNRSLPGIDTNIKCEVIEVSRPKRLVYTWQDCMMSQPFHS